jgi:hypothetical protein
VLQDVIFIYQTKNYKNKDKTAGMTAAMETILASDNFMAAAVALAVELLVVLVVAMGLTVVAVAGAAPPPTRNWGE